MPTNRGMKNRTRRFNPVRRISRASSNFPVSFRAKRGIWVSAGAEKNPDSSLCSERQLNGLADAARVRPMGVNRHRLRRDHNQKWHTIVRGVALRGQMQLAAEAYNDNFCAYGKSNAIRTSAS